MDNAIEPTKPEEKTWEQIETENRLAYQNRWNFVPYGPEKIAQSDQDYRDDEKVFIDDVHTMCSSALWYTLSLNQRRCAAFRFINELFQLPYDDIDRKKTFTQTIARVYGLKPKELLDFCYRQNIDWE